MATGLQSVKYSPLQYPHKEETEKNSKFFCTPVSRIGPKNVKRGPLGVFEHPFFYKLETKLKGDPLETFKKVAKKVLQSQNNLHKKFFGPGRDSNPRPSAW